MRNMMLFVFVVLMLSGCETVKYTFDQIINEKSELGYDSEKNKSDNWLACTDAWIKKNLW